MSDDSVSARRSEHVDICIFQTESWFLSEEAFQYMVSLFCCPKIGLFTSLEKLRLRLFGPGQDQCQPGAQTRRWFMEQMTLSVSVSSTISEDFAQGAHEASFLQRFSCVNGTLVEVIPMVQPAPSLVPWFLAFQSSGSGRVRSCLFRDVTLLSHVDFLSTALFRKMSPRVISYVVKRLRKAASRQYESCWKIF